MQSIHWYFWRLKSMSPAEILWRVSGVDSKGFEGATSKVYAFTVGK